MQGSGMSSILLIVIMLVVFYVLMIVPENKRKKKLNAMRDSLKSGDKIITIGGLMGTVVSVSDDSVTFETGEDQVRIQVTKWAIQTNVRAEEQAAKEAQEKRANGGLFGKKKDKDSE